MIKNLSSLLLLIFILPSALAESKVALVIGNSKYEQVGKLDNTLNDARLLDKKLTAIGFKTTLLLDATEANLKKALRDFGDDSERSEIGLVFYAGHGVQVAGENFLLPIDMVPPKRESDIALFGINVDDVLNNTNSKVKILILDACRDNPVVSRGLRGSRGGALRGLANPKPMDSSPEGGVFIAYATESGNVASDGRGANSPFTTALAEHISKSMSIDDMFSLVTRDVRKLTNNAQRPFKYASMESVVCLADGCNKSGGELTIAKDLTTSGRASDEKLLIRNEETVTNISNLLVITNPHEIYKFITLNPGHPREGELIDRIRALSAYRISGTVMLDSVASNDQLWFYTPKTYKNLGNNKVSIILSYQELKSVFIFTSVVNKAMGAVFDCKVKKVGTYLMGELTEHGEVINTTLSIDPSVVVMTNVSTGSVLDHAWTMACTSRGLLPLLPEDFLTLNGWELLSGNEQGTSYISRGATFGNTKYGISFLRQFYKSPKVFAPSKLEYSQEIFRYRFDCEKRLVSIDGEYINDKGKVVVKTTSYGSRQWVEILPSGAAEITFQFACKQ